MTGGGDDFASPFQATYDWSASSSASGAQSVVAHDNAGLTSSASFTVTTDTTAPSGQAIDNDSGPYYTTLSVPLTTSDGSDSGSGLDASSGVVERQSATLTDDSCVSWSGFSPVSPRRRCGHERPLRRVLPLSLRDLGQRRQPVEPVGVQRHGQDRHVGSVQPDRLLLFAHERSRRRPDGLLPSRPRRRLHGDSRLDRRPVRHRVLRVPGARLGLERHAVGRHHRLHLQLLGLQPGGAVEHHGPEQRRPHVEPSLVHGHARRNRARQLDQLRRRRLLGRLVHELASRSRSRRATAASGVQEIRYTTDGSDPSPVNGTVYSTPFSLGATTTVKFRAYDRARQRGDGRLAARPGRHFCPGGAHADARARARRARSSTSRARRSSTTRRARTPAASRSTRRRATRSPGSTRSAFPALGGMTGGGDDSSSPYQGGYSWTSASSASGSQTVTAHEQRGSRPAPPASRRRLTRLPRQAARSTMRTDTPVGSVTITTDDGTDVLSGVDAATGVIERDSTNLVGGNCDPFAGSWSAGHLARLDDRLRQLLPLPLPRLRQRRQQRRLHVRERRQGLDGRAERARPDARRDAGQPQSARRRHDALLQPERRKQRHLHRHRRRHRLRRLRHRQASASRA